MQPRQKSWDESVRDTLTEMCGDRRQSSCHFCILYRVPGDTSGKEPTCRCRRCKRLGFNPWVGKIAWRKACQPSPVFMPGKYVDRGGLRATVHGVTKSRTRLKQVSTTQHIGFKNWTFIVSETPFKEGGSVYLDTFFPF